MFTYTDSKRVIKTEAEKKEEFLEAYKKLVMEHGYDFFQQPPTILKVDIIKEQPK